ncbi:MAG: ECF-type sigma factor [Myxococcota bacterium]
MASEPDEALLTQLLREARRGDTSAADRAYALIYRRLHDAARAQLRKGCVGHATLTPTALVHEAWLKLSSADFEINDREHYLAMASGAMRQIVVDAARARLSRKRGGQALHITWSEDVAGGEAPDVDVLLLEEALEKLEQVDARLAQVVQFRYFAGLTEEEIARLLGVTDRTVRRDWRKARAFLHHEIRGVS